MELKVGDAGRAKAQAARAAAPQVTVRDETGRVVARGRGRFITVPVHGKVRVTSLRPAATPCRACEPDSPVVAHTCGSF